MSGKILIVDDEEAVRFFTADALTRAGWQEDGVAWARLVWILSAGLSRVAGGRDRGGSGENR